MPNRLLIVEREGKYTASASAVLRSDQWRVETIDSIEDALAIIRIRAPQAVLIDANLGDRRTVDFVVEVGSMSEGRQVPIFVVAEPGTATDAGRLPRVTMLNAPLSAYSLKTALELAVAPSAADTGEPILSVEAFDSAFAGILAEPMSSPAPESSAKKGPSPQEMLLRDFPELADAAVGAEPKIPFAVSREPSTPRTAGSRSFGVPPERAETPAAPAPAAPSPAAPSIDWQMGEALLSPREEEPETEVAVAEVLDVEVEAFEGGKVEAETAEEAPPAPPLEAKSETFLFSLDDIGLEEETESRAAGVSTEPRALGGPGAESEEEGGFEPWSVPEPGAAAAFEDRTPVPPERVGDEEFSVEPTSLSFESGWETPPAPARVESSVTEAGGGAEWSWEETSPAEESQASAPATPEKTPEAGKSDWAENLVWEFGEDEEAPAVPSEPAPAAASATGAEEERFEFTSWAGESLSEPSTGEPTAVEAGMETGAKGGLYGSGLSASPLRQGGPGAAEGAEESIDDALDALESFRPEFPLGEESGDRAPSRDAPPVNFSALREETGSAPMAEGGKEDVPEPLLLDSEEELWAAGPEAPSVTSAGRGEGALGPAASGDFETLIRMRVQEAVMEMIPAVTERIVAETVEKMRQPSDND
jgi:ActR/RegA family two-component response regulator